MHNVRESLIQLLDNFLYPNFKLDIEVEWDAEDFDLFIGQASSKFYSEKIYRIKFTNDFTVTRSSEGRLKTLIKIKNLNPEDPKHTITHEIEKTTDEAVSGARFVTIASKLGLCKDN